MLNIKSLFKAIVSFLFVISFVISSTAAFAEIVGRLSVHWSPKHHSAKHAQIFADEVNKRANGKLKIEVYPCLLYTSPSPRDGLLSRMPSSA